ncbi:MAG: CHAT domain-containing protein, partial [Candidatus Eisenbacteria bacterium]
MTARVSATRLPCFLLLLPLLLTPRVGLARVPSDPAALHLLRVSDSLYVSGRSDSAARVVAPLERQARASGDRNLLMEVRLRQAASWVWGDQVSRGAEAAREGLALAEALDDSLCVRIGLRWLGYAHLKQSHLDDLVTCYTRLLELALVAGDRRSEGYARGSLAYRDLLLGRLPQAERGYRLAGACFDSLHDARNKLWTMVGLARVQTSQGDYAAACSSYRAIERAATATGSIATGADAINNLGTTEYGIGDPARAVSYWEWAVALYRQAGVVEPTLSTEVNIAIAKADLGRFDEAARDLERIAAVSDSGGFLRGRDSALGALAELRLEQGRDSEAVSIFHRMLDQRGGGDAEIRSSAVRGLARAIAATGHPAEALELLLHRLEPARARLPVSEQVALDIQIGRLEMDVGRTAEARTRLAAADRLAGERGLRMDQLNARVASGECERALGHPDRALSVMLEALGLWESERRVSSDPEWRVQRGQLAGELCSELIDLLLADSAAVTRAASERQAFDVLQRFKARTQLERMSGPVAPARPVATAMPVGLDEVRSHVLRAGEVLLDTFVGRRHALLFAVTRDQVRVVRLPDPDALVSATRLYRDLIAGGGGGDPGGEAVRLRAGHRLSAELLGPVHDLVRDARRVVVAADGPLNLLPIEGLPFVSGAGEPEAPLLASREVVRVPSATLLATIRSAVPRSAERPLLAFASATDDSGRALPGAVAEVRWLARRFGGVEARVFERGHAASLDVGELARYQVLHIASHTHVDDQRPWNSGVLLAAGPAAGASAYLEAWSIAAS